MKQDTINTTSKNVKTYAWDLRYVDSWANGEDGWVENMTHFLHTEHIVDGEERAVLMDCVKPEFTQNYEVEYDGDCYILVVKDTQEPKLVLVPNTYNE